MNLCQKINQVRQEVGYLQKDKEVGGKYRAITHDAVTAALRPHLIALGIMVVPKLLSSRVVTTGVTTAKGVPFIRYEATFQIAFFDANATNDRIEIVLEAHAMDEGDKAPGKAISYATKYAMLKLFNIETGDDEEARPQMKPANQSSIDAIGAQIIDANIKPTAGVWDALTLDEQAQISELVEDVKTFTVSKDFHGAQLRLYGARINGEPIEHEHIIGAGTLMGSWERAGIKKARKEFLDEGEKIGN